jgi:uncharacterized RDD family membrane protein YckC
MSARCTTHPEHEATGTCSRCGTFVCERCATRRADGSTHCTACDARLRLFEPADRGARFLANLIDTVLVSLPFFLGLAVFGVLKTANPDGRMLRTNIFLIGVMGSIAVSVIQCRFARSGQSIGKKARRIRVVRSDGSPASLFRILVLRNLSIIACALVVPYGIGVVLIDALMIFGDRRRCLHDLMADTRVVKMPDERSASR